jgi:hypothetical protein
MLMIADPLGVSISLQMESSIYVHNIWNISSYIKTKCYNNASNTFIDLTYLIY